MIRDKWTRGKVALQNRDGRIEVVGIIKGGLAVHRTLVRVSDWSEKGELTGSHMEAVGKAWNVTHVKSGLGFGLSVRLRKDAQAAAEMCLAVYDWTGDVIQEQPLDDGLQAAHKIVLRIRKEEETRRTA